MRAIIMLAVAFVLGLLASECFAQQKIYNEYKSDTVLAISFPGDDNTNSQGSCTVIEKSLVLTAGHVVGGSEALIRFRSDAVRGRVIALDLYHDLALVRLEKELDVKPRKLRTTPLKEGEKILAVGYGRGFGYTPGVHRSGKLQGRSVPGDSGGAILDGEGEVCGVVQAYSESGELFGHGRERLVEWVKANRDNDPIQLGGRGE